jgi:hypothetical protein
MLKMGNRLSDTGIGSLRADTACASPLLPMLPSRIGTGMNLEIAPKVLASEDVMLHVVLSNLGCAPRNVFDVRVHNLEATILAGVNSLDDGASQLVVALVPEIVRAPDVVH